MRGERASRLRRVLPYLIAFSTLGALLAVGPPALAATITVNTLDDELNSAGDCSLREATEAANTNAAVDACAAGEPAPTVDVIEFSVTGTITLFGLGELLIADDLTIQGPGATNLAITARDSRHLSVTSGKILELRDVTLSDSVNTGAGTGGAIHNDGSLSLTDTIVSGNGATNCGGIFNSPSGTLTVINSSLSGNSGLGGAVCNQGTLTVTDSTFSGNSGGGIFNSGTLTVSNSSFSGNSGGGAGGIQNNTGTLTVSNSTLSGNSGSDSGGIVTGGPATVTNSTFSGNSGGIAGGINNRQSTLTVTASSFSENSGDVAGGIVSNSAGTLTLQNTIVANSTSGGNCSGVIIDGGGNLSWPDSTCPGINQDPLLDPGGLQDNGGPTETLALQAGSPAIDAASPDCPPPPTDQRGISRPEGAACDMGAYELVFGVGLVTVDPEAVLVGPKRAQVSGEIFCGPPGDRWKIQVTLTQDGGAMGTGAAQGLCTPGAVDWTVGVTRDRGAPNFAEGPALACFKANTRNAMGQGTDRLRGCAEVKLTS